MKSSVFYTLCLLVSVVYAAPTRGHNNTTAIAIDVLVYEAEHDVINIVYPLNRLNGIASNSAETGEERHSSMIFFVLGDINGGKIDYKGIFVRKNGVVTKLLDDGREATASMDDSKTAYFAAPDGIYSYNDKENRAEKYGTITDNIIGISKLNNSEALYILTEDHVVWKVTEGGTKKDKIPEIDNAQQIVTDYEDNLYYTSNNNVFVYGPDGVKKVADINVDGLKLFKAPMLVSSAIPAVKGNEMYLIFSNATALHQTVELEKRVTALSSEGTFITYVAYDKKIYEINIIKSIIDALASKFQEYLNDVIDNLSKPK